MPRRLMVGEELLVEISLQTGLKYAYVPGCLVRQIDTTPFEGKARIADLAQKLAPDMLFKNDVLVLQPKMKHVALQEFEKAMKSKDAGERRVACYQLGREASLRSVPLLFKALEDKDESVRHHALRTLFHLDDRFSDRYAMGRVSFVAQADGSPAEALLDVLKKANDPGENEWIWAATLLRHWPTSRATSLLKKGKRHSYRGTRLAAMLSGGDEPCDCSRAWKKRDPESALLLKEQLQDRDLALRAGAARIMARRNDLVFDAPAEVLGMESDDQVQCELILAQGQKGGRDVWEELLVLARSSSGATREAAIRALARCPDPRAGERLFDILTGPDMPALDRMLAAKSFGAIGSPEVIQQLADYVDRTKIPFSGVSLALSFSQQTSAVPALVQCLGVKKDTLKQYAYSGLASIGTREAVDAIVQHRNEYNNDSRYCAASGIRRIRNQEGIDRLIEIVKQGKIGFACHGLQESSDPRAVDALIEAVKGSNKTMVFLGVQALGRIGDPRAVPALLKVLNHDIESFQHEALRALRWRWAWHRADVREGLKKHPVFKRVLDDPPSMKDQKENTWVCRSWPKDLDDDQVCTTSYEAGIVFDEHEGCVLRWGSHGRRVDVPQMAETWLYDTAVDRWIHCNPSHVPVGSCGTVGLSYDRAYEKVVSIQSTGGEHGWQWERNRALRESSPWIFDASTTEWFAARPMKGPGCRKAGAIAYLDPYQVHMLYAGWKGDKTTAAHPWIYDLYANTWTLMPTNRVQPSHRRIYSGIAYLPRHDRVLFTGGNYGKADNRTWLYDLRSNTWKDAKAAGNPPKFNSAVVYDPATGTVVAFVVSETKAPEVWQYIPSQNRWNKIPGAPEPTPRYRTWDACYDPGNNVFIIYGGHRSWRSDSMTVRELWTYKFQKPKSRPMPRLPAPGNTTIRVRGRTARLEWKPVDGAKGYRVYRGFGKHPWTAGFYSTAWEPIQKTRYDDPITLPSSGKAILYYYVVAVDANGREGLSSPKLRVQPPIVTGVRAAALSNRRVRVTWKRLEQKDVRGYHVYAADLPSPVKLTADAMKQVGEYRRLTRRPVRGDEFLDRRPLARATGAFNHQVRAYVVRAVNDLGVESGPSPVTFSLPETVPRFRVRRGTTGNVVMTWEPIDDDSIAGYVIYRVDEIRDITTTRLNYVPVKGAEFVDWPGPTPAGRRRYYVVAVDALGCEGMPSEGAWEFGRP